MARSASDDAGAAAAREGEPRHRQILLACGALEQPLGAHDQHRRHDEVDREQLGLGQKVHGERRAPGRRSSAPIAAPSISRGRR